MLTKRETRRTRMRAKITSRLIYGALLLTPFGVTVLIMQWVFGWVAGLLQPIVVTVLKGLSHIPLIESIPQIPTAVCVTAATIIVLLFFVYLVGAIGQRVIGKKMLKVGETLLLKIPLVRTIYGATKQVIQAVSMPDRGAFKSVVMVDFPRPGMKAIGFVTGHIEEPGGKKFCKILIPTTPNPTTGFFQIVPVEDVTETNLTIEDAFKMLISFGIVSPDTIGTIPNSRCDQKPTTTHAVHDSVH